MSDIESGDNAQVQQGTEVKQGANAGVAAQVATGDFQHGSESITTSVNSVVYYGSVKSIPFDGVDYKDWKFQMETELISYDLLKFADDKSQEKLFKDGTESSTDKRGRLKTYAAIARCMPSSLRHLVTSVERGNSWEAWRSIGNYYQRHSQANRRKLKREFNTLKLEDFNSFGECKGELIRLASLLRSMGDTIDDDTMLTALLDAICDDSKLEAIVDIIDANPSTFEKACIRIESFLHKKEVRSGRSYRQQQEQLNQAHEGRPSRGKDKAEQVCFRFRDTGKCKFGSKCKFYHPTLKTQQRCNPKSHCTVSITNGTS